MNCCNKIFQMYRRYKHISQLHMKGTFKKKYYYFNNLYENY